MYRRRESEMRGWAIQGLGACAGLGFEPGRVKFKIVETPYGFRGRIVFTSEEGEAVAVTGLGHDEASAAVDTAKIAEIIAKLMATDELTAEKLDAIKRLSEKAEYEDYRRPRRESTGRKILKAGTKMLKRYFGLGAYGHQVIDTGMGAYGHQVIDTGMGAYGHQVIDTGMGYEDENEEEPSPGYSPFDEYADYYPGVY
jgi:hypothetical protein